MSAESLDNEEQRLVEESLRRSYRYLDDGIETLGGMLVAAGLCVIDRSDLRKALDRNGRKVALDHVVALGTRLARYNPALATKLASAIVHPFGLEVFPRVTLTDKERADRLEAAMRAMPMGLQLVEQILSGGRR